jgi:hypothetical protein
VEGGLRVFLLVLLLPVGCWGGLGKAKVAAPVNVAVEVPATLADATKAVEEVAADPVVYGTYVYERDKTLSGARAVDASSAFGKDVPPGSVFYKVVDDVIAPRHFKATEDSGSITVRYVVRAVNAKKVSIRVDAVFVETARRAAHASEGAVESAEFGQVQQHLDRIQAREKEAKDEAAEEARVAAPQTAPVTAEVTPAAAVPVVPGRAVSDLAPPVAPLAERASAEAAHGAAETPVAAGSVEELEQKVKDLRRQVEAKVKQPGAALKSAPFHTATTIQTVPGDAEVAIVILTSYWYGVQTTDGHTGWILRSQLEALP